MIHRFIYTGSEWLESIRQFILVCQCSRDHWLADKKRQSRSAVTDIRLNPE
jgi:hypothetical protein